MSDTVEIPKELLRRVMAEVEELRTAAAAHTAEAEALRTERDALLEETQALRLQVAGYRDSESEMKTLADAAASKQAAAASAAANAAREAADAGRAAAERNLATARSALSASEGERRALERTHPLPPARPSAGPTDTAGVAPDEALKRAYVAWCRRGSPLVSRAYLFAAFLREAAPGLPTAVRPVFRDRAAAGIAFSDNPAGVEYWLVTVGPVAAVLPQPSSPYEFTELAPLYAGALTPDRLGAIDLALADDRAHAIAANGAGTLGVASTGHVHPD